MTIFGVLQPEHKKKYNKTIEKNSLRVALNYFLDNCCFTLSNTFLMLVNIQMDTRPARDIFLLPF